MVDRLRATVNRERVKRKQLARITQCSIGSDCWVRLFCLPAARPCARGLALLGGLHSDKYDVSAEEKEIEGITVSEKVLPLTD